jgi:predicted amidohydrolase YtcJ
MQAIREAADKYPPGTFLAATIGTAIFRDSTVDRARLDGVAPSHPVICMTFTGHAAILNSAALTKLGISESEADPLGGRYERTSDGKLSGVLREYATVRLSRRIGDLTRIRMPSPSCGTPSRIPQSMALPRCKLCRRRCLRDGT